MPRIWQSTEGTHMDRTTARLGAVGGLAFAGLEILRLIMVAPPPLQGSQADVAGWITENSAVLRIFPWFDALAAMAFVVFAIVLVTGLRTAENGALVGIATAAATLVLGISLILDGTISAIAGTGIGASADVAPVLLATGAGVETMFPYPLALFLGAASWLLIAQGFRLLGWSALLIGLGFLAAGLLPGLDLEIELEAPLFTALLIWIVGASVGLVRGEGQLRMLHAAEAT